RGDSPCSRNGAKKNEKKGDCDQDDRELDLFHWAKSVNVVLPAQLPILRAQCLVGSDNVDIASGCFIPEILQNLAKLIVANFGITGDDATYCCSLRLRIETICIEILHCSARMTDNSP